MNAQHIAALLDERKANQKAMRASSARFNPPATPAPTVTYRGPFSQTAGRRPHRCAANPSEKTRHRVQAGDDFRDEFSGGIIRSGFA